MGIDKRALILSLDARRRTIEASRKAGTSLTDLKRALNEEIRKLRDSVTPKDEILRDTLERVRAWLNDPEVAARFRGPPGDPGKDGDGTRGPRGYGFVRVYQKKIEGDWHLICVLENGDELDAGPIPVDRRDMPHLMRLRQKVPDTQITATLTPAIAVKTANYTVTSADGVILVDTTAGAVTITMPDTVTVPRQIFTIKRIAGTNNVTIARTGTDVFEDGQTSLALTVTLSAAELVADADRATYWVI